MAATKISDVITPEIFTEYTLEPSILKSRFIQSSVMQMSPTLSLKLDGGGESFNIPAWDDIAQGSDVPSETVATTINNIGTSKQIARRQEREKAYGANNLAGILAGSNPLQAIADRVTSFWAQSYDKILINSLIGVYADNVANDASDLVNPTLTQFSDDGVIDAQSLLGENGVVGSSNGGDFVGIAVHPKIYALMRKLDLIDFMPVSAQARPLGSYMGMAVIVDTNLPLVGDVYTSIIFKEGAVAFGQSDVGYLPTETDRVAGLGFGTDNLYTRRVFAIQPTGFQHLDNKAGVSPTNVELAQAASWDRVFEKENIGFVFYDAKLA